MRAPILIIVILWVIGSLVNLYAYFQCRRRCKNKFWSKLIVVKALIGTGLIGWFIALSPALGSNNILLTKMWILMAYLSLVISTLIAVVFDLIASIPTLWPHSRWKFLTRGGIILATITFLTLCWATFINRYKIQIKEIPLYFHNLPPAFNGFKIVQFSDLHTGTFGNDTSFVSQLVSQLNSTEPDIIVFTGDIVNRMESELKPFIPVLSRLQATKGVYAILGNHDYGDYMNWSSEQEKRNNLQQLVDDYRTIGIDLLTNDNRKIQIGNDSIILIGVENIGDPPFVTYGSLRKAYAQPGDHCFKILLSHNPRHWTDSIAPDPNINIPLTLSGHTHAMQIEIAGHTPASLRYKTWGGLYHSTDKSKQLYVNIGAGTVGIPARIGAKPEITVFTLHNDAK